MSFTHTQTQQTPTYVTVVSGLPRSGTSMMMQMLAAGGLSAMTDAIRQADADNPRGYFEVERVKRLKDGDGAWMSEAQGKAIKIISALLEHLPSNQRYKVIFMQRTLAETLASQRKMLIHRGEDPARIDDAELTRLFQKHLQKVEAWLAGQPNIAVLYVNYNEMIAAPSPFLAQINRFLDQRLNSEQMLGPLIEPCIAIAPPDVT